METLRETDSGTCVPCHMARLTCNELASAQLSWGREFQRRGACGVHDDDALIWTRGLMSHASSAVECGLNGYVITAAGDVQGIVVFDEELQKSKLQPATALAYVRYLATAPWNRRCEEGRGRYRGVGRSLVARAVVEGVALGCRGHVGLHSFVAAGSFYERLGFINLGVDPSERGMLYFELLPNAAHALLETANR